MILQQGDCLELMKNIPDKSVDMILCDLPYGTTRCKWDNIIPFEPLWKQYKRIVKDRGAIVLFGSEPFSTKLRYSNLNGFKYDWVWNKVSVSNPQLAKKHPLKNYEMISVFGKGVSGINYFPQGLVKMKNPKVTHENIGSNAILGNAGRKELHIQEYTNYPKALELKYPRPSKRAHPTQKPVDLLEYLIKTYTHEGEVVLDNCMGSGSTGVACVKNDRDFIGIEKDENYFNKAKERIYKTIIEVSTLNVT